MFILENSDTSEEPACLWVLLGFLGNWISGRTGGDGHIDGDGGGSGGGGDGNGGGGGDGNVHVDNFDCSTLSRRVPW